MRLTHQQSLNTWHWRSKHMANINRNTLCKA